MTTNTKAVSLDNSRRVSFPVIVAGETITHISYNPSNPLLLKGITKIIALFQSKNLPDEMELKILDDNLWESQNGVAGDGSGNGAAAGDGESEAAILALAAAKRMAGPMGKVCDFLDELIGAMDSLFGRGVTEKIFEYDDADMSLLKRVINIVTDDIAASRKTRTDKYKA